MSAISLRLPDDLEMRLDHEARQAGVPRSEIARSAIESYLDRVERERFLADFIAEARATYGDAASREEVLTLADEAIPLDNEALDLAEGRSARPPSATGRRRKARP
jgi:predicted transcriptional regulator